MIVTYIQTLSNIEARIYLNLRTFPGTRFPQNPWCNSAPLCYVLTEQNQFIENSDGRHTSVLLLRD